MTMPGRTSRRRLLAAAAGAAATTGLLGSVGADPTPDTDGANPATDAPYTVVCSQRRFLPATLAVPKGATVTFLGNRNPHTVTSTDSLADVATNCGDSGTAPYNGEKCSESMKSGCHGVQGDDGVIRHTVEDADEPYNVYLESGGTTEITYEAVGRFPYYCIPHCGSFMAGEIVVGGVPE